jgi:hypothetical protein
MINITLFNKTITTIIAPTTSLSFETIGLLTLGAGAILALSPKKKKKQLESPNNVIDITKYR